MYKYRYPVDNTLNCPVTRHSTLLVHLSTPCYLVVKRYRLYLDHLNQVSLFIDRHHQKRQNATSRLFFKNIMLAYKVQKKTYTVSSRFILKFKFPLALSEVRTRS